MKRWLHVFEYISIFCLTTIPLLWGFTRYPKLVGDEGIYVSQAWWLVGFGSLGPYTYWYDHFPLGWFMIGLWQKLTGGPFLLDIAEFSGRLFSILIVGTSMLFTYSIIKNLTKSRPFALFGISILALSPIGLIFHRQVLLENFAVLWLMISIWSITVRTQKNPFWLIVGSLSMGLATLTKESLLFLIPGFLFSCLLTLWGKSYRNLLFLFCSITIASTLLIFPLFAHLKGELFSVQENQVSLISTVQHQMARGNFVPWWQPESEFLQKLQTWTYLDPLLICLGFGAILINLLTTYRQISWVIIHLLSLSFIGFLIRGGLVLDYYIIPLLPLLTIEISLFVHQILQKMKHKVAFLAIISLVVTTYNIKSNIPAFTLDAITPQLQAYKFITEKSKKNDVVVTDNYFFLNLRFNQDLSPRFPNTHWYTKIESDPYIRQQFVSNHAGTVDWLMVDDMIKMQLNERQLPLISKAKTSMEIATASALPQEPLAQTIYQKVPYVIEPITLFKKSDNLEQFEQLSSQQKLGKIIWTSLESDSLTNIETQLIKERHISGIVLQKKNIKNTSQLPKLIESINEARGKSDQLFVAISFEGGPDSPIPWFNGIDPLFLKSASEAKEMAQIRGNQLKNIGVNTILGPKLNNQAFFKIITETYQDLNLIPFIKVDSADPSMVLTFAETNARPYGLYITGNNLKKSYSNPVLIDISQSALSPSLFQNQLELGGTILYYQDSNRLAEFISNEDLISAIPDDLIHTAVEKNNQLDTF